MPEVLTEDRHDGGYVIWEDGIPHICREPIVLLSGAGKLMAGTVLGKVANALTGTISGQGSNAGNPTFTAIAIAEPAGAGVYTITFIDNDDFVLADPNGKQIGHGDLGVAFNQGGVTMTPAAGGTPAQAGDTFLLTVAPGSGKYVAHDPTGNDGRQNAAGILFAGRDATAADKKALAHVRGPMRVNANELVWGANVTTNQHKLDALAELKALGILAT